MKILKFILIALSFSFLFSCDNITEEIHLNADGSGEYEFYSDMIPAMVQMAVMFAEMDTSFQGTKEDLTAMVQQKVMEDFPSEIDSIMEIDDERRNRFIDEPAKHELAQNMIMYMEGGSSKGYVNSGMRCKFDNAEQLNLLMEMVGEGTQEEGGGKAPDLGGDTSFKVKKKCFERTTVFDLENSAEQIQEAEEMRKMFGNAKYVTKVHLPKNVKSVSGEGIKKKTDRMVIFEYDLIDMIQGKVDPSFKIQLR